jgi:hypothetical protein
LYVVSRAAIAAKRVTGGDAHREGRATIAAKRMTGGNVGREVPRRRAADRGNHRRKNSAM